MLRTIAMFVLLPALAIAQNPAVEANSPAAPPTTQSRSPQPNSTKEPGRRAGYQAYTFYNAIRRGTREEVSVRLSVQGLVSSPKSPIPGVVPLTLELQPMEGFTVTALRYPAAQARRVKFQNQSVRTSWWPVIFFKIRASNAAALGNHSLQGRLTFQVIPYDGSAPLPVQQIDVQIPITVVEHNAKVQKSNWPENRLSPGMKVLVIALLPVEIPVGLLLMVGCGVSGTCPD